MEPVVSILSMFIVGFIVVSIVTHALNVNAE